MTGVSIVVPTVGRSTLAAVLAELHDATPAGRPIEVVVVEDYAGRGPAATRNAGWQAARHPWVVFLDDDVRPGPDWLDALDTDLEVADDVAGVQGRVHVPLPTDRRPTDWERVTADLAKGRWLTADMAYRRSALVEVGGFDERFPRAFREDAELAYRVQARGWRLVTGRRQVTHPVRPESRWVSLRTQRGNADDALLRRLYGRRWRSIVDVPAGRRSRHAMITAALVGAAGFALRRRHLLAGLAGAAWLAGTAEFALARILPGPRSTEEFVTMLSTSVLIPPLACWHWSRGWLTHRRARIWGEVVEVYFSPPWETRFRDGPQERLL